MVSKRQYYRNNFSGTIYHPAKCVIVTGLVTTLQDCWSPEQNDHRKKQSTKTSRLQTSRFLTVTTYHPPPPSPLPPAEGFGKAKE